MSGRVPFTAIKPHFLLFEWNIKHVTADVVRPGVSGLSPNRLSSVGLYSNYLTVRVYVASWGPWRTHNFALEIARKGKNTVRAGTLGRVRRKNKTKGEVCKSRENKNGRKRKRNKIREKRRANGKKYRKRKNLKGRRKDWIATWKKERIGNTEKEAEKRSGVKRKM